MNTKYLFISTLILSILFSCKSHNSKDRSNLDTTYNSNGSIEQILKKKNFKLEGYSEIYYDGGGIKSKKFFINDTAFGPFFEYYPSGRIKKFSFLVDNNVFTYSKDFDELGRLIEEKGNPFVKNYISESSNSDTLFFKFLFCDYGFVDFSVELSSDATDYKKALLKESKINLTKQLIGWKLIRDLYRTSFYVKMTGLDSIGKNKTYYDTLTIRNLRK